ncbi:MAG TPA: von Willebrand factor type A domain-containing protein [archaeon]|nr:von Willebrand factor type A domain-containing protein [archaeon]
MNFKNIFGAIILLVFIGFIGMIFLSSLVSLGATQTGGQSYYSQLSSYSMEPGFIPLNPPNDDAFFDTFFKNYGVNPFIDTEDNTISTFAADVDTASYSVMRAYLNQGLLPPEDSIRVEEYLNYFKQDYSKHEDEEFKIYLEGSESKFGENKKLLKIDLQGKTIQVKDRKKAILTFVVDVSGSMDLENRLGLVKRSLELLVGELNPEDKIGIAVYGTNGRTLLEHSSLDEKQKILNAINSLETEGATNAEEGILTGYSMAEKAFEKDSINRVILLSDGVANVGNTGPESILKLIEEKKDKGIYLTTVGFGMANFNDILMEQLADKGNGSYAYVDTINEAEKIFKEELTGTLQVIAKDAKIQVEFNPESIERYRLIGFENRRLKEEDFRNDKVDAGEIGAEHSVTALYELKFSDNPKQELGEVRIRFKNPENESEVKELRKQIKLSDFSETFEQSSARFRFTAGVAEYAEILKKSYWAEESKLEDVLPLAEKAVKDLKGDKEREEEFIELIKKAIQLKKSN